MLNLIRKDFLVTYSNKFAFYMLLLLIPLLLFFIDNFDSNTSFMYSVLTFVFISTRTPFAYDMKDKPHLFIQSLPVTKTDIVISKYISIFVNFLIGSIFTTLYISFLSLFNLLDISVLKFSTVIFTLSVSIFLVSISLPAEFMFTPKMSNLINIIIYVTFLNLFIIGDNRILNFINIFSDYRIGIGLILVLLYFSSMGLSIVLYKNRKFY